MSEFNQLADLLGNLDAANPAAAHLQEIYNVFKQHFIVDGVVVDGVKLKIYVQKSRHPLFQNKPETFVHIVTRESGNKRIFDAQRANKIHWVKPVLVNCDDPQVYIFDKAHDKTGAEQRYFWLKSKSFVVVLRKYHSHNYLLTAFCVEPRKAEQFTRWHLKGQCNKKPHIMCGARNLGIATG